MQGRMASSKVKPRVLGESDNSLSSIGLVVLGSKEFKSWPDPPVCHVGVGLGTQYRANWKCLADVTGRFQLLCGRFVKNHERKK